MCAAVCLLHQIQPTLPGNTRLVSEPGPLQSRFKKITYDMRTCAFQLTNNWPFYILLLWVMCPKDGQIGQRQSVLFLFYKMVDRTKQSHLQSLASWNQLTCNFPQKKKKRKKLALQKKQTTIKIQIFPGLPPATAGVGLNFTLNASQSFLSCCLQPQTSVAITRIVGPHLGSVHDGIWELGSLDVFSPSKFLLVGNCCKCEWKGEKKDLNYNHVP